MDDNEIEIFNKMYLENLNCKIMDAICDYQSSQGPYSFLTLIIDKLSLMSLNEEIIKRTIDRYFQYRLRQLKNIEVHRNNYKLLDDEHKHVLFLYKYDSLEVNVPKKILNMLEENKLSSFKFEIKRKSNVYIIITKKQNKWFTDRLCLEC